MAGKLCWKLVCLWMAPGPSNGDGEAVCVHWTSSSSAAQERTDHGLVHFAIWTWNSCQSHHRVFHLHCTPSARQSRSWGSQRAGWAITNSEVDISSRHFTAGFCLKGTFFLSDCPPTFPVWVVEHSHAGILLRKAKLYSNKPNFFPSFLPF